MDGIGAMSVIQFHFPPPFTIVGDLREVFTSYVATWPNSIRLKDTNQTFQKLEIVFMHCEFTNDHDTLK